MMLYLEVLNESATSHVLNVETEKHHGIVKIFRVFDKFSETIAENPFAEYAW